MRRRDRASGAGDHAATLVHGSSPPVTQWKMPAVTVRGRQWATGSRQSPAVPTQRVAARAHHDSQRLPRAVASPLLQWFERFNRPARTRLDALPRRPRSESP